MDSLSLIFIGQVILCLEIGYKGSIHVTFLWSIVITRLTIQISFMAFLTCWFFDWLVFVSRNRYYIYSLDHQAYWSSSICYQACFHFIMELVCFLIILNRSHCSFHSQATITWWASFFLAAFFSSKLRQKGFSEIVKV